MILSKCLSFISSVYGADNVCGFFPSSLKSDEDQLDNVCGMSLEIEVLHKQKAFLKWLYIVSAELCHTDALRLSKGEQFIVPWRRFKFYSSISQLVYPLQGAIIYGEKSEKALTNEI